jgi:hypothetical protein
MPMPLGNNAGPVVPGGGNVLHYLRQHAFPRIKKHWISMSLQNKLISLVLLCTLSPLLILMPIFYHRTWTSTMTEYTFSAKESLNKSAELINRELLNLAQKSQYVSSNEKLFEKVRRDYGDNLLEKVIFYNDVNLFLERYTNAGWQMDGCLYSFHHQSFPV